MIDEQKHHAARTYAAILRGLGHTADKNLLRFNDIVMAATESFATLTRAMTPKEARRTLLKLICEMTCMCFKTTGAYVPKRGPLYELEQYRFWASLKLS